MTIKHDPELSKIRQVPISRLDGAGARSRVLGASEYHPDPSKRFMTGKNASNGHPVRQSNDVWRTIAAEYAFHQQKNEPSWYIFAAWIAGAAVCVGFWIGVIQWLSN